MEQISNIYNIVEKFEAIYIQYNLACFYASTLSKVHMEVVQPLKVKIKVKFTISFSDFPKQNFNDGMVLY